ncbi:MAG: hypothetical protein DHS20C16_29130 [Phycisphaerae bacterium]|nr:MAG: hypothetical protein DHS20C16_29130 [Phycisphaerae bacterium]
MNQQNEIVIQSSVYPSPEESRLVSQIASSVGRARIELAASADDFHSQKNSQDPISRKWATESGNDLSVVAWYVNAFPAGRIESVLESLLPIAGQAGIERISFAPANLSNSNTGNDTYMAAMNQTVAALAAVMPLAERSGVRCCLRPAQGRFLTSPVELREVVTGINSPMLGIDLPTCLPDGVPHWIDWLKTLEPNVDSVRLFVSLKDGVDGVVLAVEQLKEAIGTSCEPRPFDGVITISRAGD